MCGKRGHKVSLWLPAHMAGPCTPALSSPCPLDTHHTQELSWAKGPMAGERAGILVVGLPRVHSGSLLVGWQVSTAGQEPSLKCWYGCRDWVPSMVMGRHHTQRLAITQGLPGHRGVI